MKRVLYLFDIDGTMVDMTPVHVKAYKAAYKKVLGINVSKDVLVRQFGNVERKIQEAVFRHYKQHDKGRINKVTSLYLSDVTKAIKASNVKVLPGVVGFLKDLKSSKQPLGIVTGNTKKTGEAILKKAKIHHYFDLYSYGHVNERAHIVKNALRMAEKKRLKFSRAIVIGDSPFDIRAGKANKVFTVAVSTGRYSYDELKKEKPDVLLRSLKARRILTDRLK